LNKKKKGEKERSLNFDNIYVSISGTCPFIICEVRTPCEYQIDDVIESIDNCDISNFKIKQMRQLLATGDIRSSLKVFLCTIFFYTV
jgi:hypothetical protein